MNGQAKSLLVVNIDAENVFDGIGIGGFLQPLAAAFDRLLYPSASRVEEGNLRTVPDEMVCLDGVGFVDKSVCP